MQRREKILLGVCLSALVLWQGGPFVAGVFLQPFNDRHSQIVNLEQTNKRKQTKKFEIELATRKLKNWGTSSLPPNPLVASTVYQHWLIELVTKAKLADATVSPSRGIPKGDVYTVLPFTVKAEGKLSELCDFLYEFQRADLLHRIARMTLDSSEAKADPVLDITLNIEAVALAKAPERMTLFAPGRDTAVAAVMQSKKRSDYESITKHNLFVRGYNGPPAPTPPRTEEPKAPPTSPASEAAQFTFLVAALAEGEQRSAWLFDRRNNQRSVLAEGSSFDQAGLKGTVQAIGPDYVTLQITGETWRLELGQNLKEMQKQPAPPGAAATPAAPGTTPPAPAAPATAASTPTATTAAETAPAATTPGATPAATIPAATAPATTAPAEAPATTAPATGTPAPAIPTSE